MTNNYPTHSNQPSEPQKTESREIFVSFPDSDDAWALEELRAAVRPPVPVPQAALDLLVAASQGDTGGSQAARSFLFWLAARPDPTGYQGSGGLELRRMDRYHKAAALEVLTWWAGPTQSDQPLYDSLSKLA